MNSLSSVLHTMDILRYNDLDVTGLAEEIQRVEGFLREGNFRAADAKKLVGTRFYRARLNDKDRLLFTFAQYKGAKYILLLEVIRQHAYHKSRFLNGAVVDESHIEDIPPLDSTPNEAMHTLAYVNPKSRQFHVLDRILSFDDLQNEIFALWPPMIVIGCAGSGKTVLTLEKLKQLTGKILYVTLSPFLADNARNLYYANGYDNDRQEIDFLSYREFLESIRVPEGRLLTYRDFAGWFSRHRHSSAIKDTHKVYEEIHGVLTGLPLDAPWLSREQYLALGVRQSIFLNEQRPPLYDLFLKYLDFLKSENFYNPNLAAYFNLQHVRPTYDFVVVDEVQDITNVQLYLVLKSLRTEDNFVLCGDANQIVHPNFFSWAHVKSLFYEQRTAGRAEIIRVLNANYRNSPQVIELANRLLLIKNARFGSIDKESNYLVRSVRDEPGIVEFAPDDDRTKRELDEKTRQSARTAVIVMREEDKAEARRYFHTPLLFSIQEAKGLEYETIVLYNMVSGSSKEFDAVVEGVTEDDVQRDELAYARARDKGDKSLEAYKFFINALYVAMTRAIRNLYFVERNSTHKLFSLLGLSLRTEPVKVKAHVSSQEEWKAEARRLELQGKNDQADDIRKRILAQKEVPWKVLRPENLKELKREALDPAHYNRQAKLLLFEYAVTHHVPYLFDALAALKFKAAENPFEHQHSIEQKYYREYLAGDLNEIKRKVGLYGVDFRNPLNQTPLMIAAQFGMEHVVKWLIQNGANPQLTDNWGRTPLQIALRAAYRSKEFAARHIGRIYADLAPASIKVKVDDRLVKIDNKRMEFFLVNSMLAILQDILRVKIESDLPAFQTGDFVHALQYFPDHVIPAHRKRRSYLTNVLARNEANSLQPYNRKLFVRISHGYYILNPLLEIEVQDNWINVYDLIHLSEMEKEKKNHRLQFLISYIHEWRKEHGAIKQVFFLSHAPVRTNAVDIPPHTQATESPPAPPTNVTVDQKGGTPLPVAGSQDQTIPDTSNTVNKPGGTQMELPFNGDVRK